MRIEKEGRRYYVIGNTFPIKDALRSAGCKWDADKKAWWTSKAEVAQQFEGTTTSNPGSAPAEQLRETLAGDVTTIAGKGRYKDRVYFLLGFADRYGDVGLTESRTGKYKLASMDGSLVFWAAKDSVQVERVYQRLQNRNKLKHFAQQTRMYGESCGHICPVNGHRCTPEHPCHDCE